MKFSVSRDALIKPLNLVAGVVERRQTLPILSNVLLSLEGNRLSLTGTDLEVELVGRIEVVNSGPDGDITVPARKLVDICKSLPDGVDISFSVEDGRVTVKAGRSRFTLSTLPAAEFPTVEAGEGEVDLELSQSLVRQMIERTGFAMAQQDVRYYLNGMYLEIKAGRLRFVATDGHRLALCTAPGELSADDKSVIVPRKGILELARLLDGDDSVTLTVGSNHIRAATDQFTFTSKLVDGKFPDYKAVMAQVLNQKMSADRQQFHEVLARTAVLTNEKYRGIRLELSKGSLKVSAHNPEHEEAIDEIPVDYAGTDVEIGFNVTYLMDALKALTTEQVEAELQDANTGFMLHEPDNDDTLYLIMPMRL